MPEDFYDLFYNDYSLAMLFNIGWQEQSDCYGRFGDRDAFCMYLCISI